MKLPGLVGPSYQMLSLPFDAQRTINMFPVQDPQGKEATALYGTPGLNLFCDSGSGETRGAFTAGNQRCFFVAGATLFEIISDGTKINRGGLLQSAGNVTFADNGLQLAVCDGQTLYIFTYTTNAFAKVTDPDFPGAATVTFLGGYFIVNKPNSAQFYISALYNGLSWAALDFATAESSPDGLVRVIAALGQLWLLGDRTVEIWTNTGGRAGNNFPFQILTGARIDAGCIAAHSAVAMDNSLLWLGADEYGRAFIYKTTGFSPVRISTEPIELKLQEALNLSLVKAYGYQQQGHLFYVLTGGALETTFCYDVNTQLWHERAYLNDEGLLEQHLGSCCTFAFNKHLVGDRRNGKIYEMSMNYYSDDGEEILRERIFTHIADENKRIRYNSLEFTIETGVGALSGDDADPLIALRISKDLARTWSNPYTTSFGKLGDYIRQVAFRRLGISEQMTFRIRISSRVKISIIGAYLK